MPKKVSKKKAAPSMWDDLNKVTSVSKVAAAVLFISLPFVGFYLGLIYQQSNVLLP